MSNTVKTWIIYLIVITMIVLFGYVMIFHYETLEKVVVGICITVIGLIIVYTLTFGLWKVIKEYFDIHS